MIRDGEENKEFREKLKNVPKPINDTSTSDEMEDYLKKVNEGTLKSEKTIKKEAEQKKNEEETKRIPYCPYCRKPGHLKLTPQRMWACGFCGLVSNSPMYMMETKRKDNYIENIEKDLSAEASE